MDMAVKDMAINDMALEGKNSEVTMLSDSELDDVNGGFIWFVAAGAYLIGVGAVAGYYATRALLRAK